MSEMEEEDFDYDLDVLVVEEETAPPWRFKWGGEKFEMPLMLGMPLEDQLALEHLNTGDSLRLIMGEVEFERLLNTKGGPNNEIVSAGRMQGLIREWNRYQGLDEGESRASRRSYGSTARPSKRTSRSGRGRRTS